MVKVVITCEQVVRYKKEVDISEEEMETYDAAVERDEDDSWFATFVERHIDVLTDLVATDDFEEVEVSRQ